jgi:Icc-related predicted phosphoesterase
MKITLVSDLHLEFDDLKLPGGEVLVIAGDACESRTLNNYKYDPYNLLVKDSRNRRMDRAARFFWEECAKYSQVIYIMGNHEHYHGKMWKTWNEINRDLPDNIELLEQQRFDLDDVTFLGATLWTDCNRGDPVTVNYLKNMMTDYRVITNCNHGVYRKLHPGDTCEIHQQTKDWLRSELAKLEDRKVVVVTHHAPSHLSIADWYKEDREMNGGYSSDLSELILDHPQIRLWCHGHMHDPFDYAIGTTRVVCNPRGYAGNETRAQEFEPVTFEV